MIVIWYLVACIAGVGSGQWLSLCQRVDQGEMAHPMVHHTATAHPNIRHHDSSGQTITADAVISMTLMGLLRGWLSPTMGDRRAPQPVSVEPLARAITVKVIVGKNSGSGILVERRGMAYRVLTNHHVLNAGAPYQIQTPDGRIYSAKLLSGKEFQREDRFLGNDLELLQFASAHSYAIASLNPQAPLKPGEGVFAAGFPHEETAASETFILVNGQISFVLSQPFVGGYRIGYNTFIPQGMSGGPLLNQQGEVVGVNGLHAYPLWGSPYVFKDGSVPNPQIQGAIARSSWAIPIATFICLAPSTNLSLSVPVKHEDICSSNQVSAL